MRNRNNYNRELITDESSFQLKNLICKIIDTPTGNDYIEMRAKGFEEISPQRKYHGISTQIIAQIKNVRVPFNVDIGVGDIIVPRAEERTINTQLPDFEAPVIKKLSPISNIGISRAVVAENISHSPVVGFFFLIIAMNILLSYFLFISIAIIYS